MAATREFVLCRMTVLVCCCLLLVACCFLIALKVVFIFVDVSLLLEPVRSCFVTFCLCAVGIGIAALVIVVVVCRYD